MKTKNIIIKDIEFLGYQEYVIEKCQSFGVKVIDVNIERSGDLRNYILTVEYPNGIAEDDIVSIIERDCILKA